MSVTLNPTKDFTGVAVRRIVGDTAQRLINLLRAQALTDSTNGLTVPTNLPFHIVADPGATAVWIGQETTSKTAAEMLDEAKDLSGLTWDQLARIMGVSRRSLHFWINGRALSAEHEERLHRITQIVEMLAGRSQLEVRSRLLDKSEGMSVFDLLVAERDDEALQLARRQALATGGPVIFVSTPRQLDDATRARRATISAMDALEHGGVVTVAPTRLKRARRMRPKDGS